MSACRRHFYILVNPADHYQCSWVALGAGEQSQKKRQLLFSSFKCVCSANFQETILLCVLLSSPKMISHSSVTSLLSRGSFLGRIARPTLCLQLSLLINLFLRHLVASLYYTYVFVRCASALLKYPVCLSNYTQDKIRL